MRLLAVALGLLASTSITSSRIVSVADLHGDFERTVKILTNAKLIDARNWAWIGGNATLVQTGDITDRGPDGKKIYELFFRLAEEAAAAGGSVINLLGNHEVMNLMGNLGYVSEADFTSYGGRAARARAWAPEGWLGSRVLTFPAVARVGGVLFVHAGLEAVFLDDASELDGINTKMRLALEAAIRHSEPNLRGVAALLGDRGPLWTREFEEDPEQELCPRVEDLLRRTRVLRMVKGHDVQPDSQAHIRCGGSVVLADTAISRAYGGESSFIEHDEEGGAVVVYPDSGARVALLRPPGEVLAAPRVPAPTEEANAKMALALLNAPQERRWPAQWMVFAFLVSVALFAFFISAMLFTSAKFKVSS